MAMLKLHYSRLYGIISPSLRAEFSVGPYSLCHYGIIPVLHIAVYILIWAAYILQCDVLVADSFCM